MNRWRASRPWSGPINAVGEIGRADGSFTERNGPVTVLPYHTYFRYAASLPKYPSALLFIGNNGRTCFHWLLRHYFVLLIFVAYLL
jgi:hypothetical protein